MKVLIFLSLFFVSTLLFHDSNTLNTIKAAQLSEEEELCLIKNAYHEAFNQGTIGMALVTQVVLNRAYKKNKSFCEIVYAPYQFSWTLFKERKIHEKDFQKVRKIVFDVYHGFLQVPANFENATYFHTKAVKPKWRKAVVKVGIWKDHIFYETRQNKTRK